MAHAFAFTVTDGIGSYLQFDYQDFRGDYAVRRFIVTATPDGGDTTEIKNALLTWVNGQLTTDHPSSSNLQGWRLRATYIGCNKWLVVADYRPRYGIIQPRTILQTDAWSEPQRVYTDEASGGEFDALSDSPYFLPGGDILASPSQRVDALRHPPYTVQQAAVIKFVIPYEQSANPSIVLASGNNLYLGQLNNASVTIDNLTFSAGQLQFKGYSQRAYGYTTSGGATRYRGGFVFLGRPSWYQQAPEWNGTSGEWDIAAVAMFNQNAGWASLTALGVPT